jgi:hypothetical protein
MKKIFWFLAKRPALVAVISFCFFIFFTIGVLRINSGENNVGQRPVLSKEQNEALVKLQTSVDNYERRRKNLLDLKRTDVCTIADFYQIYGSMRDEYNSLRLPLRNYLTVDLNKEARYFGTQLYANVYTHLQMGEPMLCNSGFETDLIQVADDAMKSILSKEEFEKRHVLFRAGYLKAVRPHIERAFGEFQNSPLAPLVERKADFLQSVRIIMVRWDAAPKELGISPEVWRAISK